jgi:DNA mismatch repair ATPase MutS
MSRPGRFSADNTMFIDAATHRALELTKTQYGTFIFIQFPIS